MSSNFLQSKRNRLRQGVPIRGARVVVAICAAGLSLTGCDVYRQLAGTGECDALSVRGAPTAPVAVGDTVRLRVSLRDSQNRPVSCLGTPNVAFSSSAPQIISVSSDGLVQALAVGQSVITARSERTTQSITIRVVARAATALSAKM